jgi:hypothetical protein
MGVGHGHRKCKITRRVSRAAEILKGAALSRCSRYAPLGPQGKLGRMAPHLARRSICGRPTSGRDRQAHGLPNLSRCDRRRPVELSRAPRQLAHRTRLRQARSNRSRDIDDQSETAELSDLRRCAVHSYRRAGGSWPQDKASAWTRCDVCRVGLRDGRACSLPRMRPLTRQLRRAVRSAASASDHVAGATVFWPGP